MNEICMHIYITYIMCMHVYMCASVYMNTSIMKHFIQVHPNTRTNPVECCSHLWFHLMTLDHGVTFTCGISRWITVTWGWALAWDPAADRTLVSRLTGTPPDWEWLPFNPVRRSPFNYVLLKFCHMHQWMYGCVFVYCMGHLILHVLHYSR